MRLEHTEIFEASDPAVQRAGMLELRRVHEEVCYAADELDPGPPTSPGELAAWLTKAKRVFDRLGQWRDCVDDVAARREVKGATYFLTCIPTFGLVSLAFLTHFHGLATPMGSSSSMCAPLRCEVGAARNMCVERALAMKPRPDFLFFIDDDVLLPWDALIRLHEHQLPIVAGMYFLKQSPSYPLLWRDDRIGYLRPGVDFKVGDLVKVAGTGCGVLLVRTSVFEKLEAPFFKTGPSKRDDGTIEHHTEDAFFFQKCAKAGIDVYVDSSVRCGHQDRTTGRVY